MLGLTSKFPDDADDAGLRNTFRKHWTRVIPTFLVRDLGGLDTTDRIAYICIPVPTA